jgi:hypothetical protein
MELAVIDKDGFVKGWVEVRKGLRTDLGDVSRWTEKSVWTIGKNLEHEVLHRKYDGRMPCVYVSYAGKFRRSDHG